MKRRAFFKWVLSGVAIATASRFWPWRRLRKVTLHDYYSAELVEYGYRPFRSEGNPWDAANKRLVELSDKPIEEQLKMPLEAPLRFIRRSEEEAQLIVEEINRKL